VRLPAFSAYRTFGPGRRRRGIVLAHALGFVEQPLFDALLWAADLNFVRGEDSFVRAQWAQKPFVWHIYPQGDDAHLPKLDAALATTPNGLPARGAARRWNASGTRGTAWASPTGRTSGATARCFSERRAPMGDGTGGVGDLAGNLAEFAKTQLK
jgi:uncharacterized repeat protein (TIGR03837 family)